MGLLKTADEQAPQAHEGTGGSAPARKATPIFKVLGLTVGLGAILVVLLMVFIMPSLKSGPHNLPVGIVGTAAETAAWEEGFDSAVPGGFVASAFGSEEELRTAISKREIVGGLVVAESQVSVLTASAGSAAISSTLSSTATALAAQAGADVTVTDVVPLPKSDPTGIGIGGLAFPLVFGGIVPAVAFRKFFPKSLAWTVAGILTFAAVGGVSVAFVLMFVFGSISGAFWPVAAAMALGIAGLALPLAGLAEALGGKGFTIGAMVMMFLGNPLAGISTSAAWLPSGLGMLGQILPPGAAGTLVRSAAYFGGAGGVAAGLTLGAWALGGLVLLAIGQRRAARAPQAVTA
ncbi:hypothetical protein [Mycetocola zhujimingii]|uniref:hypothetical protein n=1 Tax=Mycetocola zhujimingii TaxID=2079792 RepID=UPI0018E08955|nr:hypothetical protein [Mycetocola zhujimingii]